MVSLSEFICFLGPGAFISKQDVVDFFLCFPMCRSYLVFFGICNSVTSQSMIHLFYPFGACMSPLITCRLKCSLSAALVGEILRREHGEPPIPVFAGVPLSSHPANLDHFLNQDPFSANSSLFITACLSVFLFVDDQLGSTSSLSLSEELVVLSALIFCLTCIFEKLKKCTSARGFGSRGGYSDW